MHNCIITGGAGFIASHLADRLLGNFKKIYLLDNLVRTNSLRNISTLLKRFPETIQFIHGDASVFDFSAISNVSHIFHLAATRINRCVEYPYEGHRYIADSGFNVVNHCARNKIKLYFASSASVYKSPKRFPIMEDDPCTPPTLYGSSKLYTEHLMMNFDRMMGLDYTINRYFSVYGPRMDSNGAYTEVIFNWMNSIKDGNVNLKVYGDPFEKVLDLVYVDDVVEAILVSTFQSNKEIFNVSTETGTTLSDLILTIQKVTNSEIHLTSVPETRKDIENKRVGSTEKLRSLGWKNRVDLEDGLRETYEWIASLE